ncbi:MAG: hypothetical protein ACFE8B_15950, partial [Candidatus Hermodarchaeota archaeon]
WLYALIAAIFVIIGILVPWGYDDPTAQWGGVIFYSDGDWISAFSNGATLWTFGLACFSAAVLLIFGLHGWKDKEVPFDWLFYLIIGIVLVIFPILAMVFEGTEGSMPIGPIFLIIGGVFSILVFVFDKFLGGE